MKGVFAASLSLAALVASHTADAQSTNDANIAPIVATGGSAPASSAPPPPAPAAPIAPVVVTAPPPPPTYAAPPPGASPFFVQRRVVPYHGGPVPPYARLESRPRTGLVIAGAALFGALWIGDALVGLLYSSTGLLHSAGWLAVPVAGPIIWGATEPGLSGSGGAMALLVVDSLAQAGGVVMFGVGMAMRSQVLVFTGRDTQWAIAPVAPGSSFGASIVGTF